MTRYAICTYGLYACTVSFLTYYHLNGEGLTLLILLMLFDTLTGVIKARVLGVEFQTSKLEKGVVAKMLTVIVLVFFAMIAGFITNNNAMTLDLISSVLGLLIVAEFVSIVQNTLMIRQEKYIPERDAVSYVLSWVLSLVRKAIETKTKG